MAALKRWLVLALCLAALGSGGCRANRTVDTYYPPVPPQASPQQLAQPQPAAGRDYTVAGVTFQAQMSLGCSNPALTTSTPQEIAASPLRFTATYIPGGFAPLREQWSSCDGRVASMSRTFQDSSGRHFTVSRFTARTFPQPVEVARPLKEAIRGLPGIAVGGRMLIVVETFGITVIEGSDFGEMGRIAAGLR